MASMRALAGRSTHSKRLARVVPADAALEPAIGPSRNDVHRHCVQHFVGEDRAVDRRGQRVDPVDTLDVCRRRARDRQPLPLAQVRRRLEDRIPRRQRVAHGERVQEVGGEPAAATAQLDDLAAFGCDEDRRRLHRQRLREERRHFRRRDEIAGRAQLGRSRRVVAEAGGVEREIHVALEGDRPAALGNRGPDAGHDPLAVRAGVGLGDGQLGHWNRSRARRCGAAVDMLDCPGVYPGSAACRARWS